MCRSKMAIRTSKSTTSGNNNNNNNNNNNPPSRTSSTSSSRKPSSKSQPNKSSQTNPFSATSTSSSYHLDTSVATTSLSSRTSLSSLRQTLPENIQIYDFSEIRAATNNFLAKRHSSTTSSTSSSSQSWRCTLNGKDVIIFQRKLRKRISTSDVQDKLSVVSKSHFTSIVKLLGISISGEHIYLVYDFVKGLDLSTCLRSKRTPDFTVLSTWMSRMQVATDVAHGLDYIHNTAGMSIDMVHKHVKSSGIIVTEPSFNAKICHFAAAELCGETVSLDGKLEGVTGYMSPEFKATGVATQRSDVYAFGVVILELMTGEEPIKYKFDKKSGNYNKVAVMETAAEAVAGGEGALRRWVDQGLRDSFPVEVADKLTRVALQCVQEDPDKRPDMKWVAGKISKLYLDSRIWSDRIKPPTDISVSLAPR